MKCQATPEIKKNRILKSNLVARSRHKSNNVQKKYGVYYRSRIKWFLFSMGAPY